MTMLLGSLKWADHYIGLLRDQDRLNKRAQLHNLKKLLMASISILAAAYKSGMVKVRTCSFFKMVTESLVP